MLRMMMGGPAAAIALLSAALLSAAPANAAEPAGARAFLQRLYSHYPMAGGRTPFDPTGRSASAVFDAGMIALIREDRRLAKGEVGAMDSDPLCQCQDDRGMKVDVGSPVATGPHTATAPVVLRFSEASPPDIQQVEFSLVLVNGQWRIHDIKSADTPSLRAYLIKANHDHARGKW